MGSEASRLGLDIGRLGLAGRGVRATAEAFATMALAADAGVRLVECPQTPDGVEAMLGEVLPREPAFRIVLRSRPKEIDPNALVSRIRASLGRLQRERADAVVVRAGTIAGEDGPVLWDSLLRLRDEGVVGAVGLSACICDDPVGLTRRLRPDLMQLPLSLLDQRLLASGALDEIAGLGVDVHLRSVFSQDALLSTKGAAVTPLAPYVYRLRRVLAEAGADPMQAYLAFALSRPHASHVTVGVGSAGELRALLRAAAASGPELDWSALRSETACAFARERCVAA